MWQGLRLTVRAQWRVKNTKNDQQEHWMNWNQATVSPLETNSGGGFAHKSDTMKDAAIGLGALPMSQISQERTTPEMFDDYRRPTTSSHIYPCHTEEGMADIDSDSKVYRYGLWQWLSVRDQEAGARGRQSKTRENNSMRKVLCVMSLCPS